MHVAIVLVLFAAAAPAADLARAEQDLSAGRNHEAALGFASVLDAAPNDRAAAELGLAQALDRLGLRFSAFFHYAAIVQDAPDSPQFAAAAEGAAAAADDLGDETVAPSVFDRVARDRLEAIRPAPLALIRSTLALLAFRAGRIDDARRFAQQVPEDSSAYPRTSYVRGLLQQRDDAEKAAATFRAIAAMPRATEELRQLATLALGRTLYGLHRWAEASAAYGALPRFSRHWDEALLEGAWADVRNGDPGGALGKLHSLHSPHLRDEFVPESVNLTAIVFEQRCLHERARNALEQFDREYVPMRDAIDVALRANRPVEEYWAMLAGSDTRLPAAVRQHLAKNERVSSMVSSLARLEREEARIRGEAAFSGSALREELLEAIAQEKLLLRRVGGKFVQGRLADMARLVDLLQGEGELIAFEATKGEKEMLETRFDPAAQLASQHLLRPSVPQAGHEYWPFDGEYWPDEIGYYRYTIKDACPRSEER
jgi:tetratricopeptide (TPR) repeat protein